VTACLSHCREAPALLLQLCSSAEEGTQLCKIRQRGCPMSVWGRGSGCQVAGSQRGTARRGLCSSAAPAADPVPPNRIYFHHSHPRTSLPPVVIQIFPVPEKFLPHRPSDPSHRFSYPSFAQNMSTGPCLVRAAAHARILSGLCFVSITTPSSLRLLLNVCTCTDPHVPPTKMISLTVHPAFSPFASFATVSRLLTRTSC